MTYHVFFEDDDNLEFDLAWENYYRSSISRKSIKHCYESTRLTKKEDDIEVGFSCSINSRTFVAYYPKEKGILYRKNGNNYFVDCPIKQNINEAVLVCYDSFAENITVIKGDLLCESHISLNNKQSWYAYLDHGRTDSEKISVNFGMNRFINSIPKGFKPWFHKNNQIITCSQHRKSISYLNLCTFLL